jgi:hypothetical protein
LDGLRVLRYAAGGALGYVFIDGGHKSEKNSPTKKAHLPLLQVEEQSLSNNICTGPHQKLVGLPV